MSTYPDAENDYPSAEHAARYVLDQLDLDDEEKAELVEVASTLGNRENVRAPLTNDQQIGLDKLVPLVEQARQSRDPKTEEAILLSFGEVSPKDRHLVSIATILTLASQGTL